MKVKFSSKSHFSSKFTFSIKSGIKAGPPLIVRKDD
jgi:hypothetical protein